MDRSTDSIAPSGFAIFAMRRRLAAAALIGECEAIIECGLLPEENEQALRYLVADALSAFGMQHHDQENAS